MTGNGYARKRLCMELLLPVKGVRCIRCMHELLHVLTAPGAHGSAHKFGNIYIYCDLEEDC